MKQLYPYYVVPESDSFEQLPYVGQFTEGNTMSPAQFTTEFAAYTSGDKLHMRVRCIDADLARGEWIQLHFDPDHSGRRPHNFVQIYISSDGETKVSRMDYDIIRLTPIEGVVRSQSRIQDQMWEITVELPLELVYNSGDSRRFIGLNVIRGRKGSRNLAKWSGLPGEIAIHGLQGIGDLIFARGLSPEETDEWVNRAVEESNVYYTKWEKQKLPPEMRRYARAKQSGFSLRLKREDAERARDNARNTAWGAKIAANVFEVADYWASMSDEELYDFILPGNPRAMTPSQFYGDPLTGGNRTTLKTCLETPFRFYNEETGEWWYPGKRVTNPTTGEEVVVEDNGEGFLIPEGFPNPYTRCMLVAAYRNYRLAMAMAGPYCPTITDKTVVPETSGLKYAGGISNLAYAYILSGDVRYAYKAAILIGRIAELYPYMNGGYHDGSYSDTVHLSEPSTTGTEWKKNFLEAYDLIFEAIDSYHDELKGLFAKKPDPENRKREAPFDLRWAVEQEMIPYVLYTCELERSGASDWSMRLLELEMEAAALIQNGELLNEVLTDSAFSLFSKLSNGYYRDGKYAYDSSGYVELMSAAMMRYPDWTYGFQDDGPFKEPLNLFEDPRFGVKEAIAFYYKYKCGSLSAAFGDTSVDNRLPIPEVRKQGRIPYLPGSETVFRRMPSARDIIGPALGEYTEEELSEQRLNACLSAGRGIQYSLLVLANALSADDLAPYRQTDSSGSQPSYLLQDSEVSILRSGTTAHNTKHLVLYGQPTLPHAHGDKLGLWLGAFGVHLLAFGGHYPFIWIGPKISQWELHSASCNVVLVDGRNQSPSSSIQLEHYEGSMLQVSGLANKEAYPGSDYERWVWLVKAPDGENAYVLDRFLVSNGTIFDYNTHGLDVPLENVAFEGADRWTSMEGTLAGEDIPLYGAPGYGWMKAIRKAKVGKHVSWTYPYGDCALKITALNDRERELLCCLGERGGQEMKKSPWDTYVLLRDQQSGDDRIEPADHSASFVAVMEPYEGAPFIRSVKAMERTDGGHRDAGGRYGPVGVCVMHADGSRDILINVHDEGNTVSFKDEFGIVHTTDAKALLVRYRGDRIVHAEAIGYTVIESGELKIHQARSAWEGTVTEVDIERRFIAVDLPGCATEPASHWTDAVCLIGSDDYKKPSPYYMRGPVVEGNRLTFHTDITLLRGEAGWPGSEKARVQQGKPVKSCMGRQMLIDVKPGDRFTMRNRVVLSHEQE